MRVVAFAVVLAIGVASSAAAQAPRIEIGGGYTGVNYEKTPSFNTGWIASATGYLTPWLGVAGEVSGQYFSSSVPDAPGYTYRGRPFTVSFTNLLVGPKVALPSGRRVRGFGQMLFGATRYAGDPTAPFGKVFRFFLMQPGGGVDIGIKGPFAVRAQVDVPVFRNDIDWYFKGVRWAGQLVWRR